MGNTNLIQRQLGLELEGINRGIEKFRQELNEAKRGKRYAETEAGVILIYQLMQTYYTGLCKYLSKPDKTHKELKVSAFIGRTTPNKASFIVLKVLISSLIFKEMSLLNLCKDIAEAIEADIIIEEFKQSAINNKGQTWESYVNNIIKMKGKLNSSKERTYQVISLKMKEVGFCPDRAEGDELIAVGGALLDLFIQSTGLVKISRAKENKKNSEYIARPTQAFMDYLNKIEGECEILNPILYPMLIPPVPHSKGKKAGFITPAIQVPLVKDYRNEVKPYLKEVDMPRVYEAINHIQNTAWRINKDVLNVLTQLMNEGQAIKELEIVSGTEVEVPPKPWGVLSDEEYRVYKLANPEIVKTWKVKARDIYNQNASDKSKRILYKSLVSMATKFKDEERFYYCYNLDWRGRVYPIQSGGCPNPQGLDVSKALIEFADGLALGEHGEYWLKVIGADPEKMLRNYRQRVDDAILDEFLKDMSMLRRRDRQPKFIRV
ncbi:hypothetical protein [Campylobacter curvus]|uniref:hypothetical protein n=1 Tax=Campylobacter curvus TaxID=200 RepID=UPI00146FCA3A|nr:hypothetical protein [Campylobacter curvus]